MNIMRSNLCIKDTLMMGFEHSRCPPSVQNQQALFIYLFSMYMLGNNMSSE